MNHHQRMFAGCIVLSTVLFLFQCLLVVVVVVVPQAQAFAPTTTPASFLSKTTATAVTRRTSLLQLFASADDDNTNNMSFDMNELRQRIDQEYASYVPIEGAYMTKERQRNNERPTPEKVHVVVIHAGTINQGAHTIEYPKGSGNNVILAFESLEACRKFAASLEEQHLFADPTPRQYRLDSLQNFFSTLGVFVQVVPEGVELKPPSQNVAKFGHNPSLCQTKKYLDYLFEMTYDEDDDEDDEEEDGQHEDSLGAWE